MANIEASPNNITVKGSTIFTDANAKSPTPCPTNIPSTTVYKDDMNMARAEGTAYLKNSFNLFSFSILYSPLFFILPYT